MSIEDLINNANNGQLVLRMDDEAFNELIKACDVYRDRLEDLYNDAKSLGHHPLGFSEEHLDSGKQLAQKFQEKAGAPEDSAAATFQSHIERVEEMKSLFLSARAAYRRMEEDNAHKFKAGDGH